MEKCSTPMGGGGDDAAEGGHAEAMDATGPGGLKKTPSNDLNQLTARRIKN